MKQRLVWAVFALLFSGLAAYLCSPDFMLAGGAVLLSAIVVGGLGGYSTRSQKEAISFGQAVARALFFGAVWSLVGYALTLGLEGDLTAVATFELFLKPLWLLGMAFIGFLFSTSFDLTAHVARRLRR